MIGPAENTVAIPLGGRGGDRDWLELATLFEASQLLATPGDLIPVLQEMLGLLGARLGALRSAVTLLDDATGDLRIAASTGLTAEGRRARYRVGEGITGRVVQTGESMVVPDVGREPRFLHRAADRRGAEPPGISFFCVPLLLGGRSVGALSMDLPADGRRDPDRQVQFLSVVASLLAQALRIQRYVDAERAHLREENSQLRRELQERYDFPNLVGTSGAMREVCEQIVQVCATDTTVLIRGESGTGKELIAHAIHYHSPRANGPFVKVNCAALPESLIESELFGHERGAFTGAVTRKRGRFELAHGGTIFLDEIGELTLATQVKLLRVLQERAFERVGGHETVEVDVRLITATNADLEALIRQGRFREDFYYRLNVFPIFVPPLRERKPDILLLADHFVQKFAQRQKKDVRRISTPAIDMLMVYHWPGNVRELENAIERAVVICQDHVIHAHHLPPTLQTAEATGTRSDGSFGALVGTFERDLLLDALKTSRGNKALAARQLRTTERIFNYKVRKHRIDWRRFRA
jgi:Nif-specific regulatory protein